MKRAVPLCLSLCLALLACTEEAQIVAVAGAGPDAGQADAPAEVGPAPLDPGPCSPLGWCWAYPQPTGAQLYGVWAASPSDVYAVGEAGTLLHYDGSAWQALYAGRAQASWRRLQAIWGSSASDIWVALEEGALYHFDGDAWWRVSEGIEGSLVAVWGSSASDVFAAGRWIHHFDGTRWQKQETEASIEYLEAGFSFSADQTFVAGRDGLVARYDGTSWRKMVTPDSTSRLAAIWGSSTTDIYAGGSFSLWHFDGAAWQALPAPSDTLRAIWGRSATEIYLGQHDGVHRYDGTSFVSISPTAPVESLIGDGVGGIYGVGAGGTILQGDGQGLTRVHGATASSFDVVWGRSASEVYVGGYQGVWRLDQGPQSPVMSVAMSVSAICGQAPDILHALSGSRLYTSVGGAAPTSSDMAPGRVESLFCGQASIFAGGSTLTTDVKGALYRYDGTAWQQLCQSEGVNVDAVWGSSDSDVYGVSRSDGNVLHYDGTTCTATIVDVTEQRFVGVWGTSSTNVFVLANYDEAYRYDGTQWARELVSIGAHFEALHGDDEPVAVGHFGRVFRRVEGIWVEELPPDVSTLSSVWAGDGSTVVTAFGGVLERRR